VATSVSV